MNFCFSSLCINKSVHLSKIIIRCDKCPHKHKGIFIEGNPGVRFTELCLRELHLLLSVVEPSLIVRLATEGHEGGLLRFITRVRFMFMDYDQGSSGVY